MAEMGGRGFVFGNAAIGFTLVSKVDGDKSERIPRILGSVYCRNERAVQREKHSVSGSQSLVA
jgi:hypothetical protein